MCKVGVGAENRRWLREPTELGGTGRTWGCFGRGWGLKTVMVSEGRRKRKLASCGGRRRVLIQGRALRIVVCCPLKNLLDNKMVKDVLTINPGITVLIRIR